MQTSGFASRHIGPSIDDEEQMLAVIGVSSRADLIDAVVPKDIRRDAAMQLPLAMSEPEALAQLRRIASKNQVVRSFIGQGYSATHVPGVIQRNVLENPAWYTGYTAYQAEISQGRLEALANFQTMVCDLTAMDIANASMLDEATSAAEAVMLARRTSKHRSNTVFVADDCHPQTIAVIQTRALPLDIDVTVGPIGAIIDRSDELAAGYFAVVAQYPATTGIVHDLRALTVHLHEHNTVMIVAADLLALTVLTPPGEWGADLVVGSTQRFGMPMAGGGPHAAFLACRDSFTRSLPGRLVGVSVTSTGQRAYRLTLQTREQHIRREKATSNICTAQVLPAVMASMFAVYHGPDGLRGIAARVASLTAGLANSLRAGGLCLLGETAFDTLRVEIPDRAMVELIHGRAIDGGANLRRVSPTQIGIALDETSTQADTDDICGWFGVAAGSAVTDWLGPEQLRRTSAFLTHPVFHQHRSETQMMRYIRTLSDRDLALDRTMIPLGSCTMKLNATAEMIPVSWPEFANIHPFAPADQLSGYRELSEQLEAWLCQATGYSGVSLQPNAGSQGEFAGLLAIAASHAANGESNRNICLIPESAHGTNPASAQMAGMQVVGIKCDEVGNVDLDDLRRACEQHHDDLAAVMITYPSTFGVFDPGVTELCETVHAHGGRVYVDGANMNALVGIAAPGSFGGDVSHLNLHKTFCIPHGGGGPGVGPVCVVDDLVPYLPSTTSAAHAGPNTMNRVGPVSAAPLGNAGVLPISWMYIAMMGPDGLTHATETAILAANYVAARLHDHFPVQFTGGTDRVRGGGVAHECVLDLRGLKDTSGVTAEDVAKRLMDYGFHAPTLSFPIAGTLMVEPTESEDLREIDRFCDAMVSIRNEIARVESGEWDREDNPLKNAPHTAAAVTADEWTHTYSRTVAAYPAGSDSQRNKYWPPVGRIDNVHGDRNLFCSCIPVEVNR
jgi:glycine dehydrogenase